MNRLIAAALVAAAATLAAPATAGATGSTRTFATWVAIPDTRSMPCQSQRPDILRVPGREGAPRCLVRGKASRH